MFIDLDYLVCEIFGSGVSAHLVVRIEEFQRAKMIMFFCGCVKLEIIMSFFFDYLDRSLISEKSRLDYC